MTIIRVNPGPIKANGGIAHRENWMPVVSVWVGSGKRPLRGYGVHLSGPSEIVYDPDSQSVYLHTESEVVVSEQPPA